MKALKAVQAEMNKFKAAHTHMRIQLHAHTHANIQAHTLVHLLPTGPKAQCAGGADEGAQGCSGGDEQGQGAVCKPEQTEPCGCSSSEEVRTGKQVRACSGGHNLPLLSYISPPPRPKPPRSPARRPLCLFSLLWRGRKIGGSSSLKVVSVTLTAL